MRRAALIAQVLLLSGAALRAADVPTCLRGTWEVDIAMSKRTPVTPSGTSMSPRMAYHHVRLNVTSNAFSIVAPYPEMRIFGQTNIACVATNLVPMQATFRKIYLNGKSVVYKIETRGSNSMQLVSAYAKLEFLTAYIWKKRSAEQPDGAVTHESARSPAP